MDVYKKQNKTKNQIIATHVELADTFIKRAVGLLGHKNLDKDNCMWFDECKSIDPLSIHSLSVPIGGDISIKLCDFSKHIIISSKN